MSLETVLYIACKKYLRLNGWKLLAGQPPSGTDHLPVLEIKSEIGEHKGSRYSYKPDLVAVKNQNLVIVEIKPKFSNSDHLKLESVMANQKRIDSLWSEIENRSFKDEFDRSLSGLRSVCQLRYALAYAGERIESESLWTYHYSVDSFMEYPPEAGA